MGPGLVLGMLALCASLVTATSTTVFDIATTEAHQVSVLTPSGVRATIGWTNLPGGAISMTVAIKPNNVAWLGLGIASSTGLGTSLMYGGPNGGAAVIGRAGVVSSDPVREYSLLGPDEKSVIPYDATPVSGSDVQKCALDFCVTQAQVCAGQKLCADALRCGQDKFAELSSTLNTSSSVGSTINFVSDCATPLSNPKAPDQIAALAALLDAGGCVVSSCTKRLIDKGLMFRSLNSSQFIQDGSGSKLIFILNQRVISGIPMLTPTPLLVAFGASNTANKFQDHGPGNRAFASINLDTANVQFQDRPNWLDSHVVLCFIGFGVLFPLSIVLRALRIRNMSFLPIFVLVSGIVAASVGSVIVSTLSDKARDGDPHTIIGIVSLFVVVGFLVLNMVQPVEQSTVEANAWKHAALVGQKQSQIDADSRRDSRLIMLILFRIAEVCTAGVVVGAFISGQFSFQNSVVSPQPAYIAMTIVAIVICGAALILGWMLRACRPFFFRRGRRQTLNGSNGAGALQSSPNPGFPGSTAEVETANAGAETGVEIIPLLLSWEKVSFYAKSPRTGGEPKQILKNAIGYCAPRTLTAVLGPSGAGKSTLMEILALRSRVPPSADSMLCINGTPAGAFPGVHRLIGYVPQQDVLHEFLTVLETLQFTCKMILPEEMDEEAKVERMLRVVAQLGIGHILDTRVGGETVRGLSGGERRRISIALQMLKSPSMLFLDEPTSGLDAHLALRLCKVLRELANEGRTIFATIHQPSAACFELFDRVVLLSGGYTVFSGPRTAALSFMKEVNRDVPYQWNPADWLLTVIDFKRDDDRLAEINDGQLVYTTDKITEETLRRRGVLANNLTAKGATVSFRAATSYSAINLDVSELRDNVRAYYMQVNPAKLKEAPGVIEEIVSFAIAKGLDAVDQKLVARYKVSIMPLFKKKEARNVEPCTWEELAELITTFAGSKYSFELVDSIRNAKSNARNSIARMGPSANVKFILQRMDSSATDAKPVKEEHHDILTGDYPQSFMNQVRLLSRRQVTLTWRNPQALKFQAFQNVVFGILLGALYSNVKFLKASPFQQSIVMAIILAMVAFVTLSLGTQVAFNDRLVLEREMSDSMYSPVAHFVARLIIGIPVAFFVALCLIIPAYFWVGLKPEGNAFFFFCLVNAAVVFLFDSVVFALTLFVNNVNSAYAIGNFYEAITIFFSGVFLPIYAMPIFFRWLYFLSPFSFAFGAVVVNEFQGTDNEFSIGVAGVVVRSAWPNLLILFGMGVAWRLLGLIGIIRLFRRKRPGSLSWHSNRQVEAKTDFRPAKKNNLTFTSDSDLTARSPGSPKPQNAGGSAIPQKVAV